MSKWNRIIIVLILSAFFCTFILGASGWGEELPGQGIGEKGALTATERIKRLANIETSDRIASGVLKVGIGYSFFSRVMAQSCSGISGLFAVSFQFFGIALVVWGISDIWLKSTEVEKEYKKIETLINSDRESYALECLTQKAREDTEKKDVWNLFGVLPRRESNAQREYREYIEEHK